MPKIIAVIIESAVLVCALWAVFFLSTLLHEAGHALGYLIATGNRDGHIRVGSGKKLADTGSLTVKLLPFDGCFTPPEKNGIDTKAKLITVLAGGPAVSLILTAAMLAVKFGGMSLESEVIASGTIESLINCALYVNLFTLVLSLLPMHYFHGEMKGMETDGLQIIKAVRSKEE